MYDMCFTNGASSLDPGMVLAHMWLVEKLLLPLDFSQTFFGKRITHTHLYLREKEQGARGGVPFSHKQTTVVFFSALIPRAEETPGSITHSSISNLCAYLNGSIGNRAADF